MDDATDHGGDAKHLWTPLPWDSEFFGHSIAEVQLGGLSAEEIRELDADARASGVECLYAALEGDEAEGLVQAQHLGYRLVVAALMFEVDPDEPEIPRPEGLEIRLGTIDDIEPLTEVALHMSQWSRYAIDPRFGLEQAQRLQLAALERSARGDNGNHSMIVAERDGKMVGFLGREALPYPRVDVGATFERGAGIARYLMQANREWAGERPLRAGWVAERHVACQRWLSHCGHRLRDVKFVFHRWLDEEPGGSNAGGVR